VLASAGAAPRPRLARRPVDGGVGEGDGVDGPVAADDDALQAVRRDAAAGDVAAIAAAPS
jgi:hypothetical protein